MGFGGTLRGRWSLSADQGGLDRRIGKLSGMKQRNHLPSDPSKRQDRQVAPKPERPRLAPTALNESPQRGERPRSTPTVLDEISKRIIEQLQEDGRRPYAAIGKAVGLSEAAVRQRVQRLLDAGVMQIVAVTDPLQVGFARQAMIGLRVDGDISVVADQLTAMSEVDYVVITAGSFDLMVEV